MSNTNQFYLQQEKKHKALLNLLNTRCFKMLSKMATHVLLLKYKSKIAVKNLVKLHQMGIKPFSINDELKRLYNINHLRRRKCQILGSRSFVIVSGMIIPWDEYQGYIQGMR